MPTTPYYNLPYPAYLDAADAPDAFQELALALDAALGDKAASGHVHTVATLPVGTTASDVAAGNHTHTLLPNRIISASRAVVTTSALGEATIAHGAGFTPQSGIASILVSEGGTDAIAVNLIAGAFTATNFRIRAIWAHSGLAVVGSVHVDWVLWP